jgi:glycosyltransferase involved in cell wall biosynthesis
MKNYKILAIVSSQNDFKKIIPTLKKLKKNKIIVFDLNENLFFRNKNIEFIYKNFNDYKNLSKKINKIDKKAIEWIKKWPNIKMHDNKNFKEITAYKNISLWWLVEVWFYLSSFFNFYPIKEIIKNIEIIQHIIHIESPNRIIITNDKSLIGKVTTLVGFDRKIPVECIESEIFFNFKYFITKHTVHHLIKILKQIKGLLREFSEKIIKFSIRTKNKHSKYKNKILFITHPTYIQSSINTENNEKIKEDIILGPIIRQLKKDKNNEILLVDTDPFPNFRFNFLFEKNYKHIEGYLTKEIKKKIVNETKQFSKKWNELKHEKSFIKSLVYKNIPLFDLLGDKFSELFHRRLIEAVKYIEMMKQVVKVENPNIIVIVDEYGLYGRAAIIAGKLNNVPTLAIQHGVFTPKELGYSHYRDEIFTDKFINLNYCPIPDKTAVSSEYYKNILFNSGSYPKNGVVVTGQPKYDVLAYANKIFKKKKIFKQFGIDYQKKIIVLATQPYPKHENELLLRSVFTGIKKLLDTHLIIKIHPNEYDKSFHQRIAREVGVNVVIVKDINLYELLYACDLMMTVDSTAAIEAMILGKPVITVTLPGSSFVVSYAESGATFGVYKPEDISSAIVKVLNNRQIRKKLHSNMKRFVYNHAYKIDGNASKRIVNLIKELIR